MRSEEKSCDTVSQGFVLGLVSVIAFSNGKNFKMLKIVMKKLLLSKKLCFKILRPVFLRIQQNVSLQIDHILHN